jgi:hypothetical protein
MYVVKNLTSLEILDMSEATYNTTTIPNDFLFPYNYSIKEISLPKGVTSIGELAFEQCSHLTNINLPEGITNIGQYAFYGCSSLTTITIPEGVNYIGQYAFYDCSSLTYIDVPESVSFINQMAFCACNLKIIKWRTIFPIRGVADYGKALIFIYLPEGKTSRYNGDLKNSAINDVFETLDITNLDESYAPYLTTANKVIYKKTFPFYGEASDPWYTISLPFKPTQFTHEEKGVIAPFDSNIEDAKNFWLRELTSDGFKDVTEMEANHAYIIAMPSSIDYAPECLLNGTVTFSAENVEFNGKEWTPIESVGPIYSIHPTYKTINRSKDVYVLNSNYYVKNYYNGHVFVHSAMDVAPFEAYVKLNDGGTSMRSVLPMADGKRTAVRGASSSSDASTRGVYGQRKPRKEDM